MTREEAICTLRNTAWLGTNDDRNNVEEAIEILTTDKGGEIIYRQDAIDAVKSLPRWIMDANGEFQPVDPPTVSMLDPEDAVSAIENLPSAQPERIQNNAVHLCDSCQYTYVICPSHGNDAVFGDGKGNDNICACNKYRPISAQPDIVHCPDCKYGVHSGCGDRYICTVNYELRTEHDSAFYCGYAERREE